MSKILRDALGIMHSEYADHTDLMRRAQEKQLKWLRKHPDRNLPIPSYPMNTAPGQMQIPPPPPDPLSFMLLPTGEEFGVRRPFNAPGVPRSLGGPPGHAGWPMMSRTMTHVSRIAIQDDRGRQAD